MFATQKCHQFELYSTMFKDSFYEILYNIKLLKFFAFMPTFSIDIKYQYINQQESVRCKNHLTGTFGALPMSKNVFIVKKQNKQTTKLILMDFLFPIVILFLFSIYNKHVLNFGNTVRRMCCGQQTEGEHCCRVSELALGYNFSTGF